MSEQLPKRCLNCGETWNPDTPGYDKAEGWWTAYLPPFHYQSELWMQGCVSCQYEPKGYNPT